MKLQLRRLAPSSQIAKLAFIEMVKGAVKFTAIWVMEYREIGASPIEKLSSWTAARPPTSSETTLGRRGFADKGDLTQ